MDVCDSFPARNESWKRGVNSLNTPDRMKRYQQVFSIMPGEIIDSLFVKGMLLRKRVIHLEC